MARVTPCISYFRTTQNLGRVPETLNPQGKLSQKMARVTPFISCLGTTQNLGRVPETWNPQGKVSERKCESDTLYCILSDRAEFMQGFRDTEPTRQTVRKNARVTPCIWCYVLYGDGGPVGGIPLRYMGAAALAQGRSRSVGGLPLRWCPSAV